MNKNVQPMPQTNKPGSFSERPIRALVYFEQAARELFEPAKFIIEWPKIRDDLDGCTLRVIEGDNPCAVTWIVRGMSPDRAELYNDKFARSFANALVGVLNKPVVSLSFEVIGETPEVSHNA